MKITMQTLITLGIISAEIAEKCHPQHEETFVDAMLRDGLVSEQSYLQAISQNYGLEIYDFTKGFSPHLIETYASDILQKYRIIPLYQENESMVIGTQVPLSQEEIDEIMFIFNCRVTKIMLVSPATLRLALAFAGWFQKQSNQRKSQEIMPHSESTGLLSPGGSSQDSIKNSPYAQFSNHPNSNQQETQANIVPLPKYTESSRSPTESSQSPIAEQILKDFINDEQILKDFVNIEMELSQYQTKEKDNQTKASRNQAEASRDQAEASRDQTEVGRDQTEASRDQTEKAEKESKPQYRENLPTPEKTQLQNLESMQDALPGDQDDLEWLGNLLEMQDDTDTSPVVRLVDRLFNWGEEHKIEALCIEPQKNARYLRLRAKKDGTWVLLENIRIAQNILSSITARLKIIANLDITERRLPQTGIVTLVSQKRIMVHFLPTIHKEEICIRYMQTPEMFTFQTLGMPEKLQSGIANLCKQHHGVIWVTGTSQNGRATTLYSMARYMADAGYKVICLDSVPKHPILHATQVEFNPSIAFTASYAFKESLKHSPDAIILSEVCDHETVDMVVEAGCDRTVIGTRMYVRSVYDLIIRLLDMGIDPLLASSSLGCVINQRLVRLLCPKCKKESKNPEYPFVATGCHSCLYTGFSGRKAIFEYYFRDENLSSVMRQPFDYGKIKSHLAENSGIGIKEQALSIARQGLTTLEEAIRCTL